MTRLEAAIEELLAAAGVRDFVLVINGVHPDAPVAEARHVSAPHMPFYAVVGMLEAAKYRVLRDAGALVCMHQGGD